MADVARTGTKFGFLRRVLKTVGLSDAAVDDLFEWIEERLATDKDEPVAAPTMHTLPYRQRDDFLSFNERSFYHLLQNVVSGNALVWAKVSLGDLFFVSSSDPSTYRIYTNKIDRKHVDFVLCHPDTLTPIIAIELDDKSHDRADRQARDRFVDEVFATAKLPLVRVRAQRSYALQEVIALLAPYLPTHTSLSALSVDSPSSENDKKDAVEPLASSSTAPCCPKCGGIMVLRTAKSGNNIGQQFWGCANFPRCRSMLAYALLTSVPGAGS